MKKTLLLFTFIVALASCKKNRTCSCTITITATNTSYTASYKNNYGYWFQDPNVVTIDTKTSTDNLALTNMTKTTANKHCPKSSTFSSDTDNTTNYDINNTPNNSGSLKKGNTIHEETNTACTIK